MKKTALILFSIGMFFISCSDSSKDYSNAASELCDCMQKSSYDENDRAEIKMNMSVCLLGTPVNLKDERMLAEVEKQCPEIRETFIEFLQRLDSK